MKLKATYTRRILAMMYFPDFDRKQILTIREVKLIEEFLGEPACSIEDVL